MWEVEFYERPDGQCPTLEFLESLSKKDDLPFVMKAIERLERFGHELRRPHADFLRDKIYELRVRSRKGQIRLLYFFYFRERIVVTHGFVKKSSRVPEVEIQRAIEFRQDYFERYRK